MRGSTDRRRGRGNGPLVWPGGEPHWPAGQKRLRGGWRTQPGPGRMARAQVPQGGRKADNVLRTFLTRPQHVCPYAVAFHQRQGEPAVFSSKGGDPSPTPEACGVPTLHHAASQGLWATREPHRLDTAGLARTALTLAKSVPS